MMMKSQITNGWDALKDRRWRWANAFGRLKPGVTIQQAKASLQPLYHSVIEMEVKDAGLPQRRSRTFAPVSCETPLTCCPPRRAAPTSASGSPSRCGC